MHKNLTTKAFTLLEILLVVGIIAILAGIVIVAVNPSKQIATVRDAQRRSDIKQLQSAVTQYYISNFEYPTGITADATEICATGEAPSPSGLPCTDLIDLSVLVPTYLPSIPVDPQGAIVASYFPWIKQAYAAVGGTGYKIAKNASNNIYAEAPQKELATLIAVGSPTGVTGAGGGQEESEPYVTCILDFADGDSRGQLHASTVTKVDGGWFASFTGNPAGEYGDYPDYIYGSYLYIGDDFRGDWTSINAMGNWLPGSGFTDGNTIIDTVVDQNNDGSSVIWIYTP
jgi:prepilin-type N-terminal cleavage/methylation domain-containing protein